MTEHVLRADLNGPGTAGVKPGRAARHDLHRLRRRSGRRQHRQRVGFDVKRVNLAVAFGPVAADAGWFGKGAADAGGGRELILRRVTAEHLTDFEQADIGKAAVGVPLRGSDKARE